MYIEDLSEVIDNSAIRPHFYADDSQLLATTSLSGVSDVCRKLERCVRRP